ncbi:hypothetical protein E2C01_101871 [Portunus trituberculatus]|uniref:Uncharacterized protein n=1 Tax=Portunus trituberculatus TaxID=210409 RepID=A0A5B7KGZ9_PORTR|nr:hypothetical protein [Portunus trituberculatus]
MTQRHRIQMETKTKTMTRKSGISNVLWLKKRHSKEHSAMSDISSQTGDMSQRAAPRHPNTARQKPVVVLSPPALLSAS